MKMKKLLLTAFYSLMSIIALQAQITTGLQAQYLLNGNINDSQNTNHASLQGSGNYSENRTGAANSSFSFNGSTRLALPQGLTNISEISISMWFLTDQGGGLFGHNGSSTSYHAPVLYVGSNGKLMGKLWDGTVGTISNSDHILTDSLWHHVVITADANSQKVYLDNTLVGTDLGGIISGSFLYSYIGHIESGSWPNIPSNHYFNGLIDDVRIYNIAISDTIVNELYNTPVWTPPTYAWDLDTLYVDADASGNNDGTSWANAYIDAREAFINTTENCEIWIAEGTYIRDISNRSAVFGWSKDSVMVYGGFEGGETSRANRNWDANPTIFSGDIGVLGDDSDNAYSVFSGPSGTQTYSLIDGIKITGGNADVDDYPEINSVGGGMVLDTDVDFIEIKNVEFYNNYAKQGAAISVYGFSGDNIKVSLENVVAHDNIGISSAFAHIRSANNTPIDFSMTNCLIYENEAIGTISSGGDFGTVMLLGSSSGASNEIIANITNCTFANNEFPLTGHTSKGMIRTFGGGNSTNSLYFTNNICYGNNIEEFTNKNYANSVDAFNTVNLSNNILENGLDFIATLDTNNLSSDPLFNADYSLPFNSPAVNSGTQTGLTIPMIDLAGNTRISGTEIDLGCYENQCESFNPQISNTSTDLLANTGFDAYQWYLDGVAISSETSNSFTATESGDYTCEINDNGCIKISNSITIDITTIGINDLAFENVSAFPNPTKAIINLKLDQEISSIKLMNISGQTLMVLDPNTSQLDISKYDNGIYFLELSNSDKRSIIKIIKI